jgi:hypothetical protein
MVEGMTTVVINPAMAVAATAAATWTAVMIMAVTDIRCTDIAETVADF